VSQSFSQTQAAVVAMPKSSLKPRRNRADVTPAQASSSRKSFAAVDKKVLDPSLASLFASSVCIHQAALPSLTFLVSHD
jgi:hypothetical protein